MGAGQALLLTPQEVGNIRRYVKLKYASLPLERHAEIVADAVRRTIDRQLPVFAEPVRRRMTAALIRSTVVGEGRPVAAADVLGEILRLDWRQPELLEPLARWAEQRTGAPLPRAALVAALEAAGGGNAADGEAGMRAWQALDAAASLASAAAGGVTDGASDGVAPPAVAPVIPLFPARKLPFRLRPAVYAALSVALAGGMLLYGWQASRSSSGGARVPEPAQVAADAAPLAPPTAAVSRVPGNELPAALRYADVDEERLIGYLERKSSLLRKQPYLDAIMATAKTYDIHPLLLFAITGQEQAFVPEQHPAAEQIAGNPFNVFHSWQDYNTTIEDSSAIAARTVVRLSGGLPDGIDPIAWINREYAEDPNWHKGVRSLFEAMKRATMADDPAMER